MVRIQKRSTNGSNAGWGLTVNVDIPRAASIALGAEPHIRAYEGHIKQALPTHALDAIRRLRVYALGAVYAHLESQPVTKLADLSLLTNEGTTLKQQLMVAAEALAFAGLVDDGRLAEIRAGSGHLDLATDLVALGALFDVSWKVVAGKTAIDRAQVDRASLLGTELLVALGAKDHVAPSLYQRPRRRAAQAATPPVDSPPADGVEEDSATPSSGLAPTGTD